ncbi:hypothetical protein LSTR_LSTR008075, partial [Laodelphax striatellus]
GGQELGQQAELFVCAAHPQGLPLRGLARQTSRRRDGHLLRLWAEVFHVSASGTGSVKWQQVSEDLVPVNITCIQDSPECVFHITAYNSQVDKILDVRLVQPGTRIGQASECFVYWKETLTNDTWGLNFTSPIDAKQFRECCSPSFKFSRKASSSYSLKLEPPNKQNKVKTKRKPLSTPASPSRSREPQCTCMTADQYARLRAQDPRYRGSSTLPRAQSRVSDVADGRSSTLGDKVTAATSSTSLYDNVSASAKQQQQQATAATTAAAAAAGAAGRQTQTTRDRETSTPGGKLNTTNHVASQVPAGSQTEDGQETSKSEGTQAGGVITGGKMTTGTCTPRLGKESQSQPSQSHKGSGSGNEYSEGTDMVREAELRAANNNNNINNMNNNNRARSAANNNNNKVCKEDRSVSQMPQSVQDTFTTVVRETEAGKLWFVAGSRSSHDIGRCQREFSGRGLYLELERNGGGGGCGVGPAGDLSPPSDNVLFDNQCYATTPSSSNGNSDLDQPSHHRQGRGGYHGNRGEQQMAVSTPSSPTSRLLLEYEMHLRNTLAKGMDAESYSLHTFEALLTQSMENLEFAEQLPVNTRSPYPCRRRPGSSASMNKSSTLPLPHRLNMDRPASSAGARERERDRVRDTDRDGYYSDRNELMRERERERGYLSDHNSSSRCASCLGESARAQWFRHSDGWRSGSSTLGSGSVSNYPSSVGGSSVAPSAAGGHKRSPWDSLPSLRHEGSLGDSGYKSNRADSFDQGRGMFDRQDSLRSDYMSDRETRYGIVQQASIESTDSRLCYLTSSEVKHVYIPTLFI